MKWGTGEGAGKRQGREEDERRMVCVPENVMVSAPSAPAVMTTVVIVFRMTLILDIAAGIRFGENCSKAVVKVNISKILRWNYSVDKVEDNYIFYRTNHGRISFSLS